MYAVMITAPARAWTPPNGVATFDLPGLGYQVARFASDRVTKADVLQAIRSAGLTVRTRIRPDRESGRRALRKILDEDIAATIAAWARDEIDNATARSRALAYHNAIQWLDSQAV